MIKVSVVVPVYNVEIYLERCLETLVNQTLEDIEIIVVDDGSTDGSKAIIERYSKEYPSKILAVSKENGGLSDARNFGMGYCKGQYIGFIDADDYVERDMFERLYNKAEKENCDIVVCDYVKEYRTTQEIVKARRYRSKKDMFIGGLAAAWNKIYRRELLKQTDLKFPKGFIYEDTEFFCCLIPYVQVCGYVEAPLIHYIQRKGSIVNSQGNKMAMIFDIFDHIISYYKQHELYNEYRQELEYFVIRILFGSSMERICRCEDCQLRKQLLYRTWDYSKGHFPEWKRNIYLKPLWNKRNFYMRLLSKMNITIFGTILSKCFIYKEKKLIG